GGQAPDVRRHIRRAAEEAAEAHELVRAEPVRIEALRSDRRVAVAARAAVDPEVGAPRPFVGRADAVMPVVAVGEAAAGPADHGRLELLQIVDERLAEAADIRDLRALADPDAVVDDAADMLDEMSVQLGRHR